MYSFLLVYIHISTAWSMQKSIWQPSLANKFTACETDKKQKINCVYFIFPLCRITESNTTYVNLISAYDYRTEKLWTSQYTQNANLLIGVHGSYEKVECTFLLSVSLTRGKVGIVNPYLTTWFHFVQYLTSTADLLLFSCRSFQKLRINITDKILLSHLK